MGNLGFKKNYGRMKKLHAIPAAQRCKRCAGFGFVYRTNHRQTEIRKVRCGTCDGTGKIP